MHNFMDNNRKYIFSGHETFSLRYGWLKKIFDACENIEKNKKSIIKDLFNSEEAIAILGVGKNMVASMRHWASYTGILAQDENRNLYVTDSARILFTDNGLDPWMENFATLWYIHHKLVTNPVLFLYYWVFNKLNVLDFDKETLFTTIKEVLQERKISVSDLTLRRDIECFLSMYCVKTMKDLSLGEENIESPLTELGLISHLTRRDLFELKNGFKSSISSYTFLYVLLKFWKEYSPNSSTLALEAICYAPFSPGRVFVMNENDLSEYLVSISSSSEGLLEWSETAGLKQLILKQKIDFEKEAMDFFVRNYK